MEQLATLWKGCVIQGSKHEVIKMLPFVKMAEKLEDVPIHLKPKIDLEGQPVISLFCLAFVFKQQVSDVDKKSHSEGKKHCFKVVIIIDMGQREKSA